MTLLPIFSLILWAVPCNLICWRCIKRSGHQLHTAYAVDCRSFPSASRVVNNFTTLSRDLTFRASRTRQTGDRIRMSDIRNRWSNSNISCANITLVWIRMIPQRVRMDTMLLVMTHFCSELHRYISSCIYVVTHTIMWIGRLPYYYLIAKYEMWLFY